MDPIGFALENYDGVGKWRDEDDGIAHRRLRQTAGRRPSSKARRTEAASGLELPRPVLFDTLTEKLLTYALGRGLEYYDKPAVRAIMRQAARENYRMSAFVTAIVNSTPFQMRRTPEP